MYLSTGSRSFEHLRACSSLPTCCHWSVPHEWPARTAATRTECWTAALLTLLLRSPISATLLHQQDTAAPSNLLLVCDVSVPRALRLVFPRLPAPVALAAKSHPHPTRRLRRARRPSRPARCSPERRTDAPPGSVNSTTPAQSGRSQAVVAFEKLICPIPEYMWPCISQHHTHTLHRLRHGSSPAVVFTCKSRDLRNQRPGD
jgi:hypothetical protein